MELGRTVVMGSLWASGSKYLSFAARFSGGIFLARTLTPESFGTVAFADAIIALVFICALWGETPAIIRCDKNIEKYVGTLLTLRITGISLLATILAAVSYPVYKFYGPDTFLVLIVLAASQLPVQISIVYSACIAKELLFKKQALIESCGTLIPVGVACVLAHKGYGMWALIAMLASNNILTAGLRFAFTPKRIKPCFDIAVIREFYHYGKFCFLYNMTDKLYRKLDSFSVGAFIGKQALGFYDRAYSLSEIFATLIWGGVGDVTDPLFSKLKNDRQRLEKAYETVNAITFRLSILFYLWLGITLPDFIEIVYTAKWLPVVPILQLLIPYAVICGMKRLSESLQLTAGEAKNVAKAHIFELSAFLIALAPLLYLWQAKGVAAAVDLGAIVGIIFFFRYSSKLVSLHLKRVLIAPLVSALMTIAASITTFQYVVSDNIYIRFMVQSIFIVLCYTVLSMIWEADYIMKLCGKILEQKRANAGYVQLQTVGAQ